MPQTTALLPMDTLPTLLFAALEARGGRLFIRL